MYSNANRTSLAFGDGIPREDVAKAVSKLKGDSVIAYTDSARALGVLDRRKCGAKPTFSTNKRTKSIGCHGQHRQCRALY